VVATLAAGLAITILRVSVVAPPSRRRNHVQHQAARVRRAEDEDEAPDLWLIVGRYGRQSSRGAADKRGGGRTLSAIRRYLGERPDSRFVKEDVQVQHRPLTFG
jgi:hypothetical protein